MTLIRYRDRDGVVQLGHTEQDVVHPLRPWTAFEEDWSVPATSAEPVPTAEVTPLPFLSSTAKIVCVGLNYEPHIREMDRPMPDHPTLFAKFREAIIGPSEDICYPESAGNLDWEGEFGVVIGRAARRVAESEAAAHILGIVTLNDVTSRSYQYRTTQWLQGKTWEQTSPLGSRVAPLRDDLELTTSVNGELVQRGRLSELVFTPAMLVSYISEFVTLNPGDVIATGTPGGVGQGMRPPRYLGVGDVLRTSVTGLETLENRVVRSA